MAEMTVSPNLTIVAPGAEADERLALALTGFGTIDEVAAAGRRLTSRQSVALVGGMGLVAAALVWQPQPTMLVIVVLVLFAYLGILGYRVYLLALSANADAMVTVDDQTARAVSDRDLPVYTIMIPAYREPEVVEQLVASLGELEYPADKLDVKLLLEADDDETLGAVRQLHPTFPLEVVIVPDAEPKTKPKALNYGLITARGEVVTIYDAEDHPEPLQLRRAAVALANLDERIVCLQARLVFHNPFQNLLTRWFSAEYLMWFSSFLPGLDAIDAPVPLGGTSNHFRRQAIEQAGGWDPFNVTEDADLGLRLHRAGHQVRILDSVTLEEANSDTVNWLRQRSRWYKGYLQTWLVHMRNPVTLWRQVGPKGVMAMGLFVLGTPLLALLNPLFWGLTLLWLVARPAFIDTLFPGPVLYLGLISFVIGGVSVVYMGVVSARNEDPRLLPAVLISPLYWVLMSVAAVKAFWQLLFRPSHWEKTAHGLSAPPVPTTQRGPHVPQ